MSVSEAGASAPAPEPAPAAMSKALAAAGAPAEMAGRQRAVRRAGIRCKPRRPRSGPTQISGVHAVCVFDGSSLNDRASGTIGTWRLELLGSNATARARLTALARAGREVLIALAPDPVSLAAPPARLWLFHASAASTWLVFVAPPVREGFVVELAVEPAHAEALQREAREAIGACRRGNTVEFPPAETMDAAIVDDAAGASGGD